MKTAVFQYKCRQCGEVFGGVQIAAGRGIAALVMAATGESVPNLTPQLVALHGCTEEAGHNDKGLADLVGYRVREEVQ